MATIIEFPHITRIEPVKQYDEPAKLIVLPMLRVNKVDLKELLALPPPGGASCKS